MIRSVTANQVATAVKQSEQIKNHKRQNDDARDFLHGQENDKQALTCACDRHEEMKSIPKEECHCCQSALNKTHRFKKQRHSTTIQRFVDSKDKTKCPHKAMVATGVDHTPLLLGKVQLDSIHNDQRELLIEELHVRGTHVD